MGLGAVYGFEGWLLLDCRVFIGLEGGCKV